MLIYLNAWSFHYTGNTIIFKKAEKKLLLIYFDHLLYF